MRLGITTIQRNRGQWIVEWIAFHMLVGFEHFYVYAHKCTDDTHTKLLKLARRYSIQLHPMDNEPHPQLAAYQHAYNAYAGQLDWMAFVDGDEFLHPVRHSHMADALATFDGVPTSAVAAYWLCYGSSGHLHEPSGLVMQNYPRHSEVAFLPNRHVKSVVRGGQVVHAGGAHVFSTSRGTIDELRRPIDRGWMRELEPSHQLLRINHYAVQSYEFFKSTKQNIGAADGNPSLVRPASWYFEYDRNECDDGQSYRFLIPLKLKVQELEEVIAST